MESSRKTGPPFFYENTLVYSCSGCSSAAQMANQVAVMMDRRGIAEMSCIAGVGGGVKSLVNKARAGGAIIGIDGCPLHCVEQCLKNQGLKSTVHYDLSKMGVSKDYHSDFDARQAEEAYQGIVQDLKTQPALIDKKEKP